jgi:hypothetical protein
MTATMAVPKMLLRRLLPAAVLLAAALPAGAAELVVRDLSLQAGLEPTSFSYTITDPSGNRSGSDAFSSGYGLALGGLYSFAGPGRSGGFLGGADLVAGEYGYQGGGSYVTYGGRLVGGYGYAVSDHWLAAGLVDAGGGIGNLTLSGSKAFSSYSASGIYYSYAARVLVTYAVTDHAVVGLTAGYRATTSNLSAGGTSFTLDGSGFCAALGLTWRFSNAPSPLE